MPSTTTTTAAPKKTVEKKTTKSTKALSETGIKYADKSAGQPNLVIIFEELNKRLDRYVKGNIQKLGGKEGSVSLVVQKEVLIEGKKKDEVWFAGALVQKGYVGFYFMPVYIEPALKQKIKPELLKLLKGKSCFHIKKNDAVIFQQIEEALEVGYEYFKQKDWV